MLTVKMDTRQFQHLSRQVQGQTRKAMTSALKSEGNYLRGVLAAEARATNPPLSPTTMALRKGKRSVWQILGPLMRYWVDEGQDPELHVGLLEKGPRPIERRVAVLAKKHSRGYKLTVTRAAQKSLARKLQQKHRAITDRGSWEMFGGVRSFIPRIGPHAVRRTWVVGEVLARQRRASVQRVQRNFQIKMMGGMY